MRIDQLTNLTELQAGALLAKYDITPKLPPTLSAKEALDLINDNLGWKLTQIYYIVDKYNIPCTQSLGTRGKYTFLYDDVIKFIKEVKTND